MVLCPWSVLEISPFHRMAVVMVVRVMVDREHEDESVADRQTLCQRGSGWPLVSSPKGSSRRPITNAIAVNATGVPTVP